MVKSRSLILLIVFIFGIGIVIFLVKNQYGPRGTEVGSIAPDIELVDINNNELKLTDLKGSVIFINFWATWCESCVDELPSIEQLFRNLSWNPQFKVITILYKDDRQRAFDYMQENGYTFPVYVNPDGSAAKKFGITGVPESFIIDRKSILRDKIIGPANWNSPYALETFQTLLSEP